MKKQSARTQIASKKAEREAKTAYAAGVSSTTKKTIEQQREQIATPPINGVENVSISPGKSLTNSENGSKMKLDNKEVRKKYIDEVSRIKENIDKSLPLEEQAKQACEERNAIRNEARKQMADVALKEKLDKEHPSKTFEELVRDKMKRKGMTREEAIQDVFDTATKTNADVDKELGLDGE